MDEGDLPLVLPDTDNFRPRGTPESPLSVIDDWMATTDPATGGPARRESSTMPQVTTRKSQHSVWSKQNVLRCADSVGVTNARISSSVPKTGSGTAGRGSSVPVWDADSLTPAPAQLLLPLLLPCPIISMNRLVLICVSAAALPCTVSRA